ncbi:hypothetical protein V4U95_003201 [Candida albicans]
MGVREPQSGRFILSRAKAHSMAISVTIPVARASTSAHPTRGSKVLGRGQLVCGKPAFNLVTRSGAGLVSMYTSRDSYTMTTMFQCWWRLNTKSRVV